MSAPNETMVTSSVSFFVTSPSAVVRGTKRGSDAAFGIGLSDDGGVSTASKRRKSARLSAVSMKLANASVEGDASPRGEEPAGTREANRDAVKLERTEEAGEEEEEKKKTSLKTLPKPRGLVTREVNVPAPKVIPAPKVLPNVVASESSAPRTKTKTIPAPKKVIPAPRAM
jgi:hypothetical protein